MGKGTWIYKLVLGLCAAAFGLAGCGNTGSGTETGNEKKTVVTVWTKDRHDGSFWEEKVKEYNRSNTDNIEIDYKIYSGNYAQAVDSAFQSHNAPDILAYTDQIFSEYYTQGYFADLFSYMEEELKDRFSDVLIPEVNVTEDRCWFLPTGATAARLFYNENLLKAAGIGQPPATMEELIQDAREVTQTFGKEGIYGFAINLKNPKSGLDRSIMKEVNRELGLKNGFDFRTNRYVFENYQTLLEIWRELLGADCAYPDCRNLEIDPLRQMFAEGKIAMYLSYVHAERGVYENQFPMQDSWGCVEIPTAGGNIIGSQNYALSNAYLLNAQSSHLEQAWEAYRSVFLDIDTLAEYYTKGLGTPIADAVIEKMEEQGERPDHSALLLTERDQLWPKAPHERNGKMQTDGMDIYDTLKELLLGDDEIAPALKSLSDKYNEEYQRILEEDPEQSAQIADFDPLHPNVSIRDVSERK